MKINKIKFLNYKPFFGEQIIDIPHNGKIVILRGENGAGKTTIINAMTLCLYNGKINWNEYINTKLIYETEVNSKIESSIEIHFEHEDYNHILKKGCIATRADEGISGIQDIYNLTVFNNDGTIDKEEKSPALIENIIDSILNRTVKDYFFFDGAQIEKFTSQEYNTHIQPAIRGLLKIEAIQRAKKNISKVHSDIRLSIKGDKPGDRIDVLKVEIAQLEKNKSEQEEEYSNLIREISAVSKSIKQTEDEIENIKMNSTFQNQLEKIRIEEDEIKEKLNIAQGNLERALGMSYIYFADKLFIKASKTLKQSGKNLFAPSTIKEIIKQTIHDKHCFICNQDIDQQLETELRLKLPDLIAEKQDSGNILNLIEIFSDAKNQGSNIYKEIFECQTEINKLNKTLESLVEQEKTLEDKVKKDLPDFEKHKNMLNILKKRKEEKELEKTPLNENMAITKNDLSIKYKELGKLTSENIKYFKQSKKLKIAQEIMDEIEQIYLNYEKIEILKINEEIKKVFNTLIRKEGVYTDVYIDEDYNLFVKRIFTKYNALKQISYGERQMLSLSLILALAIVSGDQAPFVMDTPMGNLDGVHRQHLLENIPNIVDQLVLLVTSSEFTMDLYDICRPYISVEYSLVYNTDGTTQIIKEG